MFADFVNLYKAESSNNRTRVQKYQIQNWNQGNDTENLKGTDCEIASQILRQDAYQPNEVITWIAAAEFTLRQGKLLKAESLSHDQTDD